MRYPESALLDLECSECHQAFDADSEQTVCESCKSPLLARYDLATAVQTLTPGALAARPRGTWRWAEVLPVRQPSFRMTLGEGDTALIRAGNLARKLGLEQLFIKDEATNPTGSIHARGLAVAVARAVELGTREFVIRDEGNAGGALAIYAARAHTRAHVFLPDSATIPIRQEVESADAGLLLVDVATKAESQNNGWLDVSAFKEPYRCEGLKTVGFELAESFDWELPDVILFPTGEGVGLVGLWKAFAELAQMGLVGSARPRMVSVQAAGRAHKGDESQDVASALQVPHSSTERLIQSIIRESNGTALSVSDEEMSACQKELAETEGIFAAPGGAATLAALKRLLADGWLERDTRVVLFNTGSGLNYL